MSPLGPMRSRYQAIISPVLIALPLTPRHPAQGRNGQASGALRRQAVRKYLTILTIRARMLDRDTRSGGSGHACVLYEGTPPVWIRLPCGHEAVKLSFRRLWARKIEPLGGVIQGTTRMAHPIIAPHEGTDAARLITYVVRRLGSVPRTKLVKLIYLTDERWSQGHGASLSGLRYVYDNHGPNAEGNLIVKIAEAMNGHELKIETTQSKWGKPQYMYKVGPAPRFEPQFQGEAFEITEEVLRVYGGLSIEDIIAASKSTGPFASGPQPGDTLDMRMLTEKARESLIGLRKRVRGFGDLDQFAEGPPDDQEPEDGIADRLQKRAFSTETE